MLKYIKSIFSNMWFRAHALNDKNIVQFLDRQEGVSIIDLGCDDGKWTAKLANKVETKDVYGVDINSDRLALAKQRGVQIIQTDLNRELPFENDMFDVVHANQVIEHVSNLDMFASEVYRILKPGGYAVISTENGSSWHNIFAAIMGWQIFSLTNLSVKSLGIGNPLAIHKGEVIDLASWTHKTIFNYRGLIDFVSTYNFKNVQVKGAGYYPFPAWFGSFDKVHSHFITVKAYK